MAGSAKPLDPDLYERLLAGAAMVLLLLVLTALWRSHGGWQRLDALVLAHLGMILLPLALTPVMLLRRRGDGAHRALGWIWAAAMFASAAISFGVHRPGHGFSFIHILSVVVVVTVPLMVLAARRHDLARHRRAVRGLITGAVLIAGYFTLLPERVLGAWLWG